MTAAVRSLAHFVSEVEARLVERAQGIPRHEAEKLRIYHGSAVPHLGLPVPTQRTALRERYSFSKLPVAEHLPIWDAVWRRGHYYETKCQACAPEDRSRLGA